MEEELICMNDIKEEEFISYPEKVVSDKMTSEIEKDYNEKLVDMKYSSIKDWKSLCWTCFYCSKGFNEFENLKAHQEDSHQIFTWSDTYFECFDCKEVLLGYSSFLNHIRGCHYEALKLCCDVCNEVLLDYKQLSIHRDKHVKVWNQIHPIVYHCTFCEEVHFTEKSLKRHIQESHNFKSTHETNEYNFLSYAKDEKDSYESSECFEEGNVSMELIKSEDEYQETEQSFQCVQNCTTESDLKSENMSDDFEILHELVHDADDADFEFVRSSLSKPRRKRKSTAGTRKIRHVWIDDEINSLIATVEQHRGLWDIGSAEYKLSKQDAWRSVVDELGIHDVDVNEAKVKWSSLRTTYMVNLANLRKKKSGHGANESHSVSWKFFKAMMFLEANNVQCSTSSTSTSHLSSAAVHRLIVDEFSASSQASTSSESAVGNQRKSKSPTTPTPLSSPSSPAGSFSAQAISTMNSAVLRSADTNSTFCDNLLAELRTLSETKARTLRYKISHLMMDFMEE